MSSPADEGARAAALFDALLALSRPASGTHPGPALEGALDALLTATGAARGAVYSTAGDALALVAARGLPAELRPALERLTLTEPPWCIAQQAAHAGGLVADRVVAAQADGPLEAALAAAGWLQATACPVVVERTVKAVLVIGAPAGELGAPALATVQIACNLLASQLARRGAEQRLSEYRGGDARSAQLAAFGLLAGGLAAELEPAVAGIERGLAEQQQLVGRVRRRMPLGNTDGEQLAALAESTGQAARHLRESAARLLLTVRPGADAERLDLGRIVEDALALLAPVLRSRKIEVRVQCPEGHLVVGRRGWLIQLVIHAVLNLAGALDERNALGEPGDAGARTFDVAVRRHDAREVLSLTDLGEDVTSTRARLLASPATMTAGDQGFGLALARQIVIAHHGHIELGPAEGGGVRCDVVLPRAAPEAELAEPSAPASPPSAASAGRLGARPSILWIDEDELSGEITAQALKGCEVHRATNAAEATQLLFKFVAPPSVIFCNLRLPDRPGHELHEDIAGFSQELADRFVFLSDGLLSKDVAGYLVKSGRPTLMRPVSVEHIRDLAFAGGRAAVRGAAPTLTPPVRPAIAAPAPAPAESADPAASRPATGRITTMEPAVSRTATGRITTMEPAVSRTATGRILGATAAGERPEIRMAPTEPQLAAVRLPAGVEIPREAGAPATGAPVSSRYQTLRSGGSAPPPPPAVAGAPVAHIRERPHPEVPQGDGASAPAMRDAQLAAIARATAGTLQREGPKRGSAVLEMLRGRGLSESEALSVVMYALSTGALLRDPPWSTMLKAREPKPNRTVLIVDDDADVRQALRDVLEEDGYTVETARHGRDALETLRRSVTPPQVVLLDMMMPVMDGWEFLHEVRQDAALTHIPVLVLSGGRETRAAQEFLRKPVDYHTLLATVARLTKGRAEA